MLDLGELFFSAPKLHGFLARDGVGGVVEVFEVDEGMNAISLREAGNGVLLMFEYAPDEVVGDADIERAIPLGREDVDVESFTHDGARGSGPWASPRVTA